MFLKLDIGCPDLLLIFAKTNGAVAKFGRASQKKAVGVEARPRACWF